MLLLIDNYDSFTYNLSQALVALGAQVEVVLHDALSVAEVLILKPTRLVISPGPGTPEAAGVSCAVLRALLGKVPILGVCLGHQCLATVLGARLQPAPHIHHGEVSQIYHNGQGLFEGITLPTPCTRYHSWVVDATSLPPDLQVTAWTQPAAPAQRLIMGIQHAHTPSFGVQFHPEALLTQEGERMLANFLRVECLDASPYYPS